MLHFSATLKRYIRCISGIINFKLHAMLSGRMRAQCPATLVEIVHNGRQKSANLTDNKKAVLSQR